MAKFSERLSERLQADLDKGEISNILHEVGNLKVIFDRYRFKREMSIFARQFNKSVFDAFQQDQDGNIDEKFKSLSF